MCMVLQFPSGWLEMSCETEACFYPILNTAYIDVDDSDTPEITLEMI